MTTKTMKGTPEIETLIEARLAVESEIYELTASDIREIRLEVYKENGWFYDPFAEEDEEEEEATYYVTGFNFLRDIWMSERDFM